MDDFDKLDVLDAELGGLERSLGEARAMTAAFDSELRSIQGTLGETTRDLGNLERGISSGLRKAFDGLAFDGMKLSDALTTVARSMVDTAYSAAINPVTQHFGGLLSDGINAAVSGLMPYANGAPFSQGRVMPFAKGGVVSQATTFPMRGGTGLMGEAGAEAILPLKRGADGALGVAADGAGAGTVIHFQVTATDAASFARSEGQITAMLARSVGRGRRGM